LDDLFDIYGWKGTNVSFSKDVTLGGVKVPKGKTFGEIMKSKIVGGDYGRPLKSREIIGITNEDVFDKTFIDMSKSKVKEAGGIFSSPSRSLGATSESEFVTAVVRERVAPMSKSRAFFKKLGFADAYVYYDWDVVPINYYKEVSKKVPLISGTNNALTIIDNKRLTGGQKNLFLEDSKKLLPGDSFELTTTRSSLVAVQKGQGGYSKELEDVFGTSTSGKKSVFSKSILKPMVTIEEIKPKKEVSFLRALEQSRSPGTFYNPAPLIRASLSKIKSVNVPRIISRPSRTTSKPSSSSSRITSRPILSISRSISRPSTSTSRTISRPSSTTSRTITRPSTSTSRTPSSTTSRTITRPRPSTSTSTGSGTGSLTSPPPSRIKSSTSSKNNRTQNPAYDVYVRKTLPGTKKVAPQLVARNVPINKGINEGTRIASRYTQRTVQLKRTGYTSMPDESLNRQRLMQYRGFKPTSKIRRQTINLVEKAKYAIDSYEEKQGIPYKGQQVRKKQAFIKKLRLI
jgi:hypothetical protein